MRTHPLALLGAALLTGSLTLACGGDDDDAPAETRSIDAPSGGKEESTGGDDGDADGETATGDTGEQGRGGDGTVLGSSRAELPANSIDDRTVPMRLDVIRLERHGDLVELTLRLTNEAPAEGDDPPGFDISVRFGESNTDYDASGIGLVDGDAQKLYLPVTDGDDNCLCTGGFGSNEVAAGGGTRTVEATYGGVPDDVETLDVQVPTFPTITGVPVQ